MSSTACPCETGETGETLDNPSMVLHLSSSSILFFHECGRRVDMVPRSLKKGKYNQMGQRQQQQTKQNQPQPTGRDSPPSSVFCDQRPLHRAEKKLHHNASRALVCSNAGLILAQVDQWLPCRSRRGKFLSCSTTLATGFIQEAQ